MTNAKPSSRKRGRKSVKRPGELGKPIRPFVVRPQGFAGPDDPVAIALANAEMEALHAQAVHDARIKKLELLLRHYELADSDWFGLVLKLAIEHEPGFEVDRQIAPLPLAPEFVRAARGHCRVDWGRDPKPHVREWVSGAC